MFLDSLVGDAAWRARYAKDRAGTPLPWRVHEADLRAKHPYEVFTLRAMLAVPYFEKALYELPDAGVTPAAVARAARRPTRTMLPSLRTSMCFDMQHETKPSHCTPASLIELATNSAPPRRVSDNHRAPPASVHGFHAWLVRPRAILNARNARRKARAAPGFARRRNCVRVATRRWLPPTHVSPS